MGSVVVGEGPTTYLLADADPFDVLLGVPHSKVPDSSPRASGGVRALSLRVCRGWVYACSVGIGLFFEVPVGAHERTRRV